eukprot:TRINITY_DN579_c0_g1_i1.p1 TRINITY_DN579_c0_g1~~TRINITY_DN579_c0_g1_i1.p1  ORF type:complete len:150 (+),score=40.11 TRINITY_DN579_c0_g1_i1:55-504(+)
MFFGVGRRQLGRDSSHLAAMFRNMVTSLIKHDNIKTTLPKAKELQRVADRIITLGKKGGLANYRHALGFVREKEAVDKVFETLSKQFADRPGGYTRLVKCGFRYGDGAPMARVMWVQEPVEFKFGQSGSSSGSLQESSNAANDKATSAQ